MLIIGQHGDSPASSAVELVDRLRDWRSSLPPAATVGLVPTMGALHVGHLSLIQEAKKECDFVALTIFVNPTQFAPGEDLDSYPKTLAEDLAKAAEEGVDLVWLGESDVLYPPGFSTVVAVPQLADRLCGKSRPHHFGGVCLIVLKLFNLFQPTHAYFGEKDLQQVTIIERMTTDLDLAIQIVRCPLVRESDGLALSSRNVRLNPAEREAALSLSRALMAIKTSWESGERNPQRLSECGVGDLDSRVELEYLEIVDRGSLSTIDTAEIDVEAVVCIAAKVGDVRLIDNIALELS